MMSFRHVNKATKGVIKVFTVQTMLDQNSPQAVHSPQEYIHKSLVPSGILTTLAGGKILCIFKNMKMKSKYSNA